MAHPHHNLTQSDLFLYTENQRMKAFYPSEGHLEVIKAKPQRVSETNAAFLITTDPRVQSLDEASPGYRVWKAHPAGDFILDYETAWWMANTSHGRTFVGARRIFSVSQDENHKVLDAVTKRVKGFTCVRYHDCNTL